VAAVTAFGLDELGLCRIQATVLPENAASLRVLVKSGYEREGLLRNYPFGKEIHDAFMLSVIR
jgi:ribosomal-protein-alanine N-acetyltransferase